MFCEKCGREISPDSIFCTYCGARVPNADGPAPASQDSANPFPSPDPFPQTSSFPLTGSTDPFGSSTTDPFAPSDSRDEPCAPSGDLGAESVGTPEAREPSFEEAAMPEPPAPSSAADSPESADPAVGEIPADPFAQQPAAPAWPQNAAPPPQARPDPWSKSGFSAASGGQNNPPAGQGYTPSGQAYPPNSAGYSSNGQSSPPNGQGFPQSAQGYQPGAQGYPPNGQGYQPNGQGYQPNRQGYPPNGQGYPPNGQGYPPNGQGYPPNGQGYQPNGQGYPNQPAKSNRTGCIIAAAVVIVLFMLFVGIVAVVTSRAISSSSSSSQSASYSHSEGRTPLFLCTKADFIAEYVEKTLYSDIYDELNSFDSDTEAGWPDIAYDEVYTDGAYIFVPGSISVDFSDGSSDSYDFVYGLVASEDSYVMLYLSLDGDITFDCRNEIDKEGRVTEDGGPYYDVRPGDYVFGEPPLDYNSLPDD